MTNKVNAKIKKIMKESIPMMIVFILSLFICFYEFPYCIEAPGGIINVTDRIEILDAYQEKGSFNMAYVSEYPSSLLFLTLAKFKRDWIVSKEEDVVFENETLKDEEIRNKILIKEANSNAVIVAYQKAKKDLKIKNPRIIVTYVLENANTNLKIGDEILEINNKPCQSFEEIRTITKSLNDGDKVLIKVLNSGKEYIREAITYQMNNEIYIGFSISLIYDYETNPKISIKTKSSESGPSGGFMTTLAIYNKLTKKDITKGKKIVGTGTIDLNGNVGPIGGVAFKLAGAAKEKADIFFVPAGENYEEAKKTKKEKNLNIKIVAISTLDEALNYLENL